MVHISLSLILQILPVVDWVKDGKYNGVVQMKYKILVLDTGFSDDD